MTGAAILQQVREDAAKGPLGVDISDYSDEFCAGFLAGQEAAVDALDTIAVALTTEEAEIALSYMDHPGVQYADTAYGRDILAARALLTPQPPPDLDADYPSTHKMTLADEGEMEC